MAEFYVSISEPEIARQIAEMVNRYNGWYTRFSAYSLERTYGRYFAEVYGDKVVACVGAMKEYPTLSKLFHICVLPEFRKRKLASKLVEMAIAHCDTEHVYMTVREDNVPSLRMAESLGFTLIKSVWFIDHYTHTLARRRER